MIQFRKYKNGQSYFRITGTEEIEELKLMGKYFKLYHIKATILPERVFIGDLLEQYQDFAEAITQQEFEHQLNWCKDNLAEL
ncbi:hypothetical protein BH09BAC1_BH09BAC1_22050 [soil metagenome]